MFSCFVFLIIFFGDERSSSANTNPAMRVGLQSSTTCGTTPIRHDVLSHTHALLFPYCHDVLVRSQQLQKKNKDTHEFESGRTSAVYSRCGVKVAPAAATADECSNDDEDK